MIHQSNKILKKSPSDYISEDLVALILKGLPVKTLMRLQCVCKSWKQVIESASFARQNLAVRKSPCMIITNSGSKEQYLLDQGSLPSISEETVTIPYKTEKALFASTVHGVICYIDGVDLSVVVWNPLTHKHFKFPLACRRDSAYTDYRGFWIDPCDNNKFKVVLFDLEKGENMSLYSSSKLAWTDVDMRLDNLGTRGTSYKPDWDSYQMTVGGVAYWRGYYLGSVIVLFFDFGNDGFGTIELPFLAPQKYVNVCKWKGSLSVAHWNIDSHNRCDLWAMQNGSWSKMVSFNLATRMENILWVLESCGRVLAAPTWMLGYLRDMVVCDPNRNVSSCCECISVKHEYFQQVIVSYEFEESLVFPDPKCISDVLAGGDVSYASIA